MMMALLAASTALGAVDAASLFGPKKVALLVGVDAYQDAALPNLRFAQADAEAMGQALGDPDASGFEVHSLTGTVTASEIRAAFAALTGDLTQRDTFVFYIASHGTLTLSGGTRLYLLASDARLEDPAGTGISVTELQERLAHLPVRRTAMIFDACYNGQGRSRWSADTARQAEGRRGVLDEPVHRPPDRFQARYYAAMVNQSARESTELGHGVYTYYLVEALTKPGVADLTGDNLVEAWEAHHYARQATMAATDDAQRPWAEQLEEGFGTIVLRGNSTAAATPRFGVIEDDGALRGVTVDGVPLGDGIVPAGRRRVEYTDEGGATVRRRVRVGAGRWISAASVLESGPRWQVGVGARAQVGDVYFPVAEALVTAERLSVGAFPIDVGAELGLGIGTPDSSFEVFSPFASTGYLGAGATWATRGRFSVGIGAHGGAAWRAPQGFPVQVGPVLEAGPVVRYAIGPGFVRLEPTVHMGTTEDGVELGGALRAEVGVRWE